MPIFNNQLAGAAGQGGADAAYQIDRSLRFNSADSSHLTFQSASSDQKTWTWSAWVKRSKLGSQQALFSAGTSDTADFFISFQSGDTFRLNQQVSGSTNLRWETSAVFRDTSSWYHFVVVLDTTQTTSTDRVKIYVNGSLIESYGTQTTPNEDATSVVVNSAVQHGIGRRLSDTSVDFNGYLADVHFIDGQALDADDFGEPDDNGVWQPKEFVATGPNNGTTWSSGAGSNFESARPASLGFDGDPETFTRTDNDNVTATVTLPSSIPFDTLQVRGARDNGNGTITINGVDVSSQFTSSTTTLETVTITGVTSPLTSIALTGISGAAQPRFSQIIVDGVALVDGDTTNIGINGFHLDFSDNSSNAALGKDASGNGTTLPGVDLDGSSYLSLADSNDFDLVSSGTGNFTIEFYVYLPDISARYVLSSGTDATRCYINGSNRLHLNNPTDSFLMESSTAAAAITANKWTHIAFCKNSSTGYIFVDGVQYSFHSGPTLGGDLNFNDLRIGRTSTSLNGYISNLRIIKGNALYTSNFTPPTAPLTNVTNTKLLCCQSSTSATAATVSPGTITANGDASATSFGDTDWTVNNITASVTSDVNYNSTLSSVGSDSITNPHRAFDGDLSTNSYNQQGVRFTPAGGSQSGVTNLEFYSKSFGQGGTIKLNGTTIETNYDFGSGGWYSFSASALSNISNTLTSFEWDRQPGQSSNNYDYLVAVKINNTILVNQSAANTDSLIDTPTNYTASPNNGGNYATLNPLNKHTSNNSLTNGNLEFTTSGNDGCLLESTIAMSSGKFYFEVVYSASGTGQLAGIRKPGSRNYNDSYIYVGTGNKYTDGGSSASYGATLAHGDVIGTAFDATNGTLEFFKNGTSQGTAFTGISGTYSFFVGSFGTAPTGIVNFGQRPFAYTPPTGYKSLCTTNLTDPTIEDPSTAMDVVTYDGNGSTQTISGLGFSPDLVWIKQRNTSRNHQLVDTVRGATKDLRSNTTAEEGTTSTGLTQFTSDGFTLGSDAGYNQGSPATYVGWTWDGGSYPTNSSYNQTAKWSDDASGTLRSVAGNTHLGAFSGLENYNNTKEWTQIAGDNTWTFAPSGGISNVQGLKVLVFPRLGTLTINVNGSQVTTNTGNSLNTVDLSSAFSTPGTLNNITITSSGSGSYWGIISVQVDTGSGYKILADPGVDTNGSIASITRANPSAGTSIISYKGTGANASIGHGLNAAPEFFFGRNLDDTSGSLDWIVYHKSLGNTSRLKLNTPGGISTSSTFFQNTSPDGSIITIGTSNDINKSGDDYILYCFAPISGYSAFGSYTGNGSPDGPFIYTGFRPAFLIIKNIENVTEYWLMMDSTRSPVNVVDEFLYPNGDGQEGTQYFETDFLSNGFKLRNSSRADNYNNDDYVYMAWAENPFKYSRAV